MASDEFDKAREVFEKIPAVQLTTEIKSIYNRISDGQDDLPVEDSAEYNSGIKDRLPFSEALIAASLSKQIEDIEKMDVFNVPGQRKWKTRMRSIMHRIIGYDRIEAKINSSLALMKILDTKLQLNGINNQRAGRKL